MSHFMVTVLVPVGTEEDAIEEAVRGLLAPYDENTAVPEYPTKCWCVGRVAKNEASLGANAEVGSYEDLRQSFAAAHPLPAGKHPFDLPEDEQDNREEAWRKHIEPREETERRLFLRHPLAEKPNPGCDECKGAGTHGTTRNPKSKWDWWTIGGRWSGAFLPGGPQGNANIPAAFQGLPSDGNVAPVEALIAQKTSMFGLVTLDGEWHERARMGWWATTSGDKPQDEWSAEVLALLEKHRGCIAVVVDCHI